MPYTMDDLLKAGREKGYSPTRRMAQDWVELGLLDRPERRGRGRAMGVSATWSQAQRDLFVSLLEHRGQAKHIAPLCNIPVWMWLYFGDAYVPLRQVRPVLATWQGRTGTISWKAARRAAAQLLDLGSMRVRRAETQAVLEDLAGLLLRSPRRFDEADERQLLRLLTEMSAPSALLRTVDGVEFTPDAYVGLLAARLRASQALAVEAVDDNLFHWARYTNVVTKSEYQSHLARLTTGAATAFVTVPTLAETVMRACLDVVTILGIGLGLPASSGAGSLDHPDTWRAKNLRTIVRGEPLGNNLRVSLEVREDTDNLNAD